MAGETPIQIFTATQEQPPIKWTDVCKNVLKKINAMQPKDRLDYVSCVADLIFSIGKTIQGWNQWYAMEFNKPFARNPLSEISEEQFEQVYKFFKTVAINMLKFDIQITEVAEEKFEAELAKKQPKKRKTKESKKRTYVT